MENPGAIFFLILFGLTTILIYLSIRRGWLRTVPSSVLGGILNSVWFMLYSLAKGNLFLQALVVGAVLGLLFTALTVSIALFFRSNPPGSGVHT
jgi:hypothetical protein